MGKCGPSGREAATACTQWSCAGDSRDGVVVRFGMQLENQGLLRSWVQSEVSETLLLPAVTPGTVTSGLWHLLFLPWQHLSQSNSCFILPSC